MKRYFFFILVLVVLAAPVFGLAAPSCTDAPSSSLCNPFETNTSKFPKIDTFVEFVTFVLGVFGGIAGIAAIVYITFNGFQFIISRGHEETVTKAKNGIQWSLTGLILMILSYVIVLAIRKSVKFTGVQDPDKINNPIAINNFVQLYQTLIQAFFGIMALVAILMLIISGYKYITAGGNEETTQDAKKEIMYSVLGIAIALFAFVIVHAVATFFERP